MSSVRKTFIRNISFHNFSVMRRKSTSGNKNNIREKIEPHTHKHAHTQTQTETHTETHRHIHTHTHKQTHTHTHENTQTYTRTYKETHTHTQEHKDFHKHTYTHTHAHVIVLMVFIVVMITHSHASCQAFSLMTQRTSKRSPGARRKLDIVFPARIKSYSHSLSCSSTRHFPLSKYSGHSIAVINFHKLVFGIIVGRILQGIE